VIILARVLSLPRFYDASVILVMFLLAWGSALSLYGSWGSTTTSSISSLPS
jgi:hypothetical protein